MLVQQSFECLLRVLSDLRKHFAAHVQVGLDPAMVSATVQELVQKADVSGVVIR